MRRLKVGDLVRSTDAMAERYPDWAESHGRLFFIDGEEGMRFFRCRSVACGGMSYLARDELELPEETDNEEG